MFNCLWEDCREPPFESELDCYKHALDIHKPSGSRYALYPNCSCRYCKWKGSKSKGYKPDSKSCNFFVRSNSHYPDHIISHFSSKIKPLPCEVCGITFRNRQQKKKHVELNHAATAELHREPNLLLVHPRTFVGYSTRFFRA